MLKRLCALLLIQVSITLPAQAANILYLNSTRGQGTGSLENYRHVIANTLDNYGDGTIFDVDFVQTHVSGDLASWLNSQPIDYYDQIWFDTTIYNTALLNSSDLAALNTWTSNNTLEFILDSSFVARNKVSNTINASAAAITVNEALALQKAGGGILIGTDHNTFAYTANQILNNFGFDSLFTGVHYITSNGAFVGDTLLDPETVGSDLFHNNLAGLSTSRVPLGTHVLNENAGNRTIEIYEALYSLSPDRVTHIGMSFDPGTTERSITDPTDVPEPSTILGILTILGFGSVTLKRQKN